MAERQHPGGSGGEILLYQTQDGHTRVECRMLGETIWLTQQQMADLFQVDKSGISRHLANIYETGELYRNSVVAKFATTAADGKTYQVEHYNLDAIISVGYRVNSLRGTQFRIWATQRLREYLVKGFALDDKRLKAAGGGGYFDELLARIRDIRSSEKIFWRKILDIYATSIDYDPKADISKQFFKIVQNRMHWASHGHTAAEIIHQRANADQPNMGLTNWPGDSIRQSDTTVAKNYLKPDELNVLNRIVTAYLELAELQALNRQPMYMKDWASRLDDFLQMTGRDLLTHAGTVTHEEAVDKAKIEYEKYRVRILNEPSPVEKHFLDAVQELKKIDDQRKHDRKENA
jgi:hypothetical protein